MPNINKIKSYVGFAIKANKVVYGVENIITHRAGVILADDTLSEKSMKSLRNYADKTGIPCVSVNALETLTYRNGCKAIAVKEPHLAQAIIAEYKGDSK